MFCVVGEDRSDVEAIKVIIKRVANQSNLTVKTKGYSGCGELLRKGAKHLRMFADLGLTHFIVCYDADRENPTDRREQAQQKIVQPSGVKNSCIVVPVQELEAWILADLSAVTNILSSWTPASHSNPESVNDPKEHIEKLSRAANQKPRYSHATHNSKVMQHVDLNIVYKRCPSFRPLHDFIQNSTSKLENG